MTSGRRSTLPHPAVDPRARVTSVGATLLVIASALSLIIGHPASAQEMPTGDPQIRLTISSITSVLGPGSVPRADLEDVDLAQPGAAVPSELRLRALIENVGPTSVDSLRLITEVHPAASSRSELRSALNGNLRSSPLHLHDPAVRDGNSLGKGEIVGVRDNFLESEVAWANDGGVHPVRVAVLRGTQVLDEVITAVTWVEHEPVHPIVTSLVWPLDEPPWRVDEGDYDRNIDRAIHTDGRLDQLIRALELTPSPNVVLAPAPHLLEDLRDRADGFTTRDYDPEGGYEKLQVEPEDTAARRSDEAFQRIHELAHSLPFSPVTGTYAAADLAALKATGSTGARDLASQAASVARHRLHSELDRAPDRAVHLLNAAIPPSVLDLLGGDQLLVPYAITNSPDPAGNPNLGAPVQRLQSPAGRALTALVADPYLTALMSNPSQQGGPLIAARRILAETAMIHFESPSATARSLLMLPTPDWNPGLETASEMLAALSGAPWLEFADIGSALSTSRRTGSTIELSDPQPAQFPSALGEELIVAINELNAARSALADGQTLIDGRPPGQLENALMRASSRWLQSNPAAAEDLVRDVRRSTTEFFGEIHAIESSVTLTSDTGQVPITLERLSGGPISFHVEVASQGRLLWPEGRRSTAMTLDEGDSATLSFATTALSTGTFPVTVTVSDPSGGHVLARSTMTVRSTAISGPALSGIGIVVAILLIVGLFRRRHRAPQLKLLAREPEHSIDR